MSIIWELVIAKAERMINKACAFDLNWGDYANELDGKLICLNILQADCTVYATIENAYIKLSTITNKTPDLAITGKPIALMQLAESSNPTHEVKIEGSAQLAQTLQAMMKQLEIDWEGFVALYTGDTVAHGLGKIKVQMEEIWSHGKNSLLDSIGDYLLYESESAPTEEEVESFLKAITDLEYDTDRIEARIKLLSEKVTDNVQ